MFFAPVAPFAHKIDRFAGRARKQQGSFARLLVPAQVIDRLFGAYSDRKPVDNCDAVCSSCPRGADLQSAPWQRHYRDTPAALSKSAKARPCQRKAGR